jgi:hypothetical protein
MWFDEGLDRVLFLTIGLGLLSWSGMGGEGTFAR